MENYVKVRLAQPEDAAALLSVYAPYVRETSVTFEYEVPSEKEFAGRIEAIRRDFPYLLCEIGGETAGYAYASHYRSRAAYQWDCELSVYVTEDYHRGGVGRMLYETLLVLLKEMHYVHAYACITTPNDASIRFHESLGFQKTAFFKECGYKCGRWYDITWMERKLAQPDAPPQPVKRMEELSHRVIGNLLQEAQKELETRLQNDIMICKNFLGLSDL